MLRWYITGFIAALAAASNYDRRGSPFRPGANAAYELGNMTASVLGPLVIGVVFAFLLGLVMSKSLGSFHRRVNWIAAIVAIVLMAGHAVTQVR